MYSVSLTDLRDVFSLENATPDLPLEGRRVTTAEINRAALQLTGFYEYFDPERVQVIGMVEYAYLKSLDSQDRKTIFSRLFQRKIPCLIFTRGLDPFREEGVPELAAQAGIPLFVAAESTSTFLARMTQYLNHELAPRMSLHGVMVDCFGEGVLILGDSGLGKSETALELVQRGHRLIADDMVEVRKTSDTELMATCSDVLQNLIELRGIGVVDVKELYGIQSIRLNKAIDMVIQLEPWQEGRIYDRVGLSDNTIDILGVPVVCYCLPIMVGRNLAMIIETAALNHRQKKMGYNAAKEFQARIEANIRMRRESRQENK